MSSSRRRFLQRVVAAVSLSQGSLEVVAGSGRNEPAPNGPLAVPQTAIARIEEMPNFPTPFKMRNWKHVAEDYDALVFDLNAKGEYMPLVWIDKSRINFDEDTFGLYVTVGDPRCGPKENNGEHHDAINDIAAVLSATMVGVDKSSQNGRNWVGMCKAYFNRANGRKVFMEQEREFDAKIGSAYQYSWGQGMLFPNLLFFQLAHYYPWQPRFSELMRTCADQFQRAAAVLKNSPRGFAYGTFDFKTMKPVMDGVAQKPGEPDGAGPIGWLEYMAYAKYKEPKYLEMAEWALQSLLAQNRNPRGFGMFLPYAACLAARMNAELGRDYETRKLVNWSFSEDSYVWPGTQVLAKRFGDYDVDGLWAAGNRAYLMETFQLAAALVPLVRYDPRFARAIGKWMLNAANAARLFYPEELPDANQSCPEYKALSRNVIAYEALTVKQNAPYATRDDWEFTSPEGTPYTFPKVSHLSLYGSSHVGVFGGIISRTDDEKILQLDCLKTDFFHDNAYPTYLYFNPYSEDKEIQIEVGPKRVNLYDTVSKRWVKMNVHGSISLPLAKDSAEVIVLVPASAKVFGRGPKLLANGLVVDYGVGSSAER